MPSACSLEVDDQFEPCRDLDRQFTRVRTFQKLVHIRGDGAVQLGWARGVREQSPASAKLHRSATTAMCRSASFCNVSVM